MPEAAREPGTSMESIERHMLLPQRTTSLEDESLECPIRLLPGEVRLFHGYTAQGEIMLTTYRLFISYEESFANIPIRSIESVECKDASGLYVVCKDATVASCTLLSSEICFKWLSRIKQELAPVSTYADYFAVTFFIKSQEQAQSQGGGALWDTGSFKDPAYKLGSEAKRLGFNLKTTWRVTNLNEHYKYCDSYPQEHLVPKLFTDDQLRRAGQFRTLRRFPSAVWRDTSSGTVLLRSSQPEVGFFCNRNTDDEALMQAVAETCGSESKMLIMDARSYTAALANRAKGGGCEYVEYYPNCDIEFMNLPNIHAIRNSFTAVRTLTHSTTVDRDGWFAALDATKWLTNLSLLLNSALIVVDSIHVKKRPVLVHCSDGWDRTSQITSLSELILDPYYRTYKGFQVLIEREWLAFGHKFADRCGHTFKGADPSEISPVFTQWLDAVYQLTCQFPAAFEFNEAYLMKLVQHSHSCLFGTFLFNNEKTRLNEAWYKHTASVWSLLNAAKLQFTNRLYSPGGSKVLPIRCHPRDLNLWSRMYSPSTCNTCPAGDEAGSPALLRSQSFSEISTSIESDLHTAVSTRGSRRLSDPDLSSSLVMSESPIVSSVSNSQLLVIGSMGSSNGFLPHGAAVSNGHLPEVSSTVEQLRNNGRSRNNSNASLKSIEPSHGTKNSRSQDSNHLAVRRNLQYSKYLDVDSHTLCVNPAQQGIIDLAVSYEEKIEELNKQLQALKKITMTSIQANCSCKVQELVSLAAAETLDAPHSGGGSSNGHSDTSWENVSHGDAGVILWMPDHAVSTCSECQVPFRVYRRRHHCRQCGLVFCTRCADVFVPIPEQQLFEPVRVCKHCYIKLCTTKGENGECEDDHQQDSIEEISHEHNLQIEVKMSGTENGLLSQSEKTITIAQNVSSHPQPVPLKLSSVSSDGELSQPVDMAGNIEKRSFRRSNDLMCQKTCSQESLNSDVSSDSHLHRRRTEC